MNTREIQLALQAKGFDPGPIDGVRGRMTIAAVKAFQAANSLVVDGIVGPRTSAALFGQQAAEPSRRQPVPHHASVVRRGLAAHRYRRGCRRGRQQPDDPQVGRGPRYSLWGRRDSVVRALRRPLHRLATPRDEALPDQAAGCPELGPLRRPCFSRSRAPSWCSGASPCRAATGPCCRSMPARTRRTTMCSAATSPTRSR